MTFSKQIILLRLRFKGKKLNFLPYFFAASINIRLNVFKHLVFGLGGGGVAPEAVAAAEDAFVGRGEVVFGIVAVKVICIPISLENFGRSAVFRAAEADDVINVGADEIVDLMTSVEVGIDVIFAAVGLDRPILNVDRFVKLGHTLPSRVIVAVDVVVPHKDLFIAYRAHQRGNR